MTVGPFGASAWRLGLGDRVMGGVGQAEAEENPVSVRESAAALTGVSWALMPFRITGVREAGVLQQS